MKSTLRQRKTSKAVGRYAAKLLFQYRVMVGGLPGKRRTCEERIITIRSPEARAALREAKRQGRAAQHKYKNNEGNFVHFEFIGVMELLRLDTVCEPNEVWYDITQRLRPMERRASVLMPERSLSAIRNRE